MNHIFDGLHEEQKKAVTHTEGPLFIIAGAGTGKTTVITRRIAYLITSEVAASDEIVALTFTEKAAGEMEERVDALLTHGYFDIAISTFHGFGEKVLRDHSMHIGVSNDFRILSETDQWMLLRENIDSFDLEYYRPKGNPTKFLQGCIQHFSRLKDQDITPEQYHQYAQELLLDIDRVDGSLSSVEQAEKKDEIMRTQEMARAYAQYQKMLRKNNALDFGDLIVEVIHLFQDRPSILRSYQEKIRHLLVDEFQDTNVAQYELVKMLAAPQNNLTVVADDDQAIYSFRGASIENITSFQKDFPDATSISLTDNFRSTQPILDIAYESIQHNNPNRLEAQTGINKRLQSHADKATTTTIEHLHADTLAGEISLVIEKIKEIKKKEKDLLLSDIAILVRANSHAQECLPYLDRSGIPYQFFAAQGLFTKPVIVDIIAFLQVIDDYHESRSFYRILTFPLWNIPFEEIMSITRYAQKKSESIFEVCKNIRLIPNMREETCDVVEKIIAFINSFSQKSRYRTVGEIALLWMDETGFIKQLLDQETAESQQDILYINQFFRFIESFERGAIDRSVHAFIDELNLLVESGDQGSLSVDLSDGPDAVRVMTIHGSKGLEFEHVFILNMVHLRFPSSRRKDMIPVPQALLKEVVVDEQNQHLEEERRLFYVALTRAKRGLYLSSALDYGGARKKKISRFLAEIGFDATPPQPTGLVDFIAPKKAMSPAQHTKALPIPHTWSFSQLETYERCPWQYRFRYILQVPAPGRASLSFGETMHKTLYLFFSRIKEQRESEQMSMFENIEKKEIALDCDDLLEIYDECFKDEWFYSKKNRDDYYKKGKAALKQFYELHHEKWPEVLYLEQRFTVAIGEYAFKGSVDRVDAIGETDETVHVIDYKTGSFPKTQKREMKQLYLYALALRQIFEKEPIKLSYYFIEENKVIEEDFNSDTLAAVSEWALSSVEKILSGDFSPKAGQACNHCDFKNICEFRKK